MMNVYTYILCLDFNPSALLGEEKPVTKSNNCSFQIENWTSVSDTWWSGPCCSCHYLSQEGLSHLLIHWPHHVQSEFPKIKSDSVYLTLRSLLWILGCKSRLLGMKYKTVHSQIPFCLSSCTPSALLKAYSQNVFLLDHHIFFSSFVDSEMLLILLCWPCLTFTTPFLMTSMSLSPAMLPKYGLYWFRSGPLLLPPFPHLPPNKWVMFSPEFTVV